MVTDTICEVGCLMSSISMAISGWGIYIDGNASNPATLNTWLRDNNGYNSDNDLEESDIPNIDPALIVWPSDGFQLWNDLSIYEVRGNLLKERVVIANVLDGTHFVLLTGFSYEDPTVFYVNDPGFETVYYNYTTIVGYRIFDMS